MQHWFGANNAQRIAMWWSTSKVSWSMRLTIALYWGIAPFMTFELMIGNNSLRPDQRMKMTTCCASMAKDIASPRNTAVAKLGTQAHEHSFARGRRLAHNDQREETLIRTLGEVIRCNVCRANVGIHANIDASTHRDRHADAHWPRRLAHYADS